MVDIETTGTDPSHTSILQIACVAFNAETGDVSGDDMFNRCLRMPADRRWDEDTRAFWAKHKTIYQGIVQRSEDPGVVVRDFSAWVRKLANHGNTIRLWAKPVSFEGPFLASYFERYGVINPFFHGEHMDVRSYIRGKLGIMDLRSWEKARPLDGVAHDAIYDALHQVKLVLEAK